ncbi:hypothetical protein [Fructobacillus tropaeoli]|uniref:Uncharacterized protein n=1 Tax=Fructobacillus tropaeoli TaxID=709323 RepID=A0ABN9YVG8_9LACO|nr:hypothetical protein [Fructobacillus tropaeoli]GIC70526.1 hypothetical protein FT12353_11970 [Fructobacillus tropaeoli]CAK1241592.1 hypothetical protein R55227_BLOPHJLP_00908 [Fructobacillus tropaeoli]CAK1247904.1 hypothetical protein R53137_KAKDMLNK_01147 [Fructobacillus tropaeoli]
MTEQLDQYMQLLKLSYPDAVAELLQKYGPAKDSYFAEDNYQAFLAGETYSLPKNPAIDRTAEGLYCHHIDESRYLNLADPAMIKVQQYPYASQQKTRLVYCNLIEHAILHALIAIESKQEFGYAELEKELKPQIEKWYIEGEQPTSPAGAVECYQKAYLSADETFKLMIFIKELVKA